jgi:hypothetical protein
LVDGEWKIDDVVRAPEMVVEDFYEWYVAAFERDGEMRSPLAEGAYRERADLSAGFKAEVEETLASFDKGGFDPILLAQDVPVEVQVGKAEMAGDEAQVGVALFWGGNPTPSERMVTVQLIDGAWNIAATEKEWASSRQRKPILNRRTACPANADPRGSSFCCQPSRIAARLTGLLLRNRSFLPGE